MVNIYLAPRWFFGYDVMLELAFAVITLIVGIYAFKVYKLSGQRQSKLFGIAFLFISVSYFIQSFLNFAIISKLNEKICTALKINSVDVLNSIGLYAYMLFFITGLITLVYMTLRFKSVKTYSLSLIIIILSLLFTSNSLHLFYLLSSILLIYIFIHYFWINIL